MTGATATADLKDVKLEQGWKTALADQFRAPYMAALKAFLRAEKEAGKRIFPKGSQYFHALDLTPIDKVKVVILGQDPYHGPGQAHGLCFSVPPGVAPPPSLVNIYKELQRDLGLEPPRHGHLTYWAEQGVLLLNSVLTVQAHEAASHRGQGWEQFTDAVVHAVNDKVEPVVFLLWGSYAQKKAAFVDTSRHLVLSAPHPSPLSAHRGFLGCKHFSQANAFLEEKGRGAIDWSLPKEA
ncbi:uracil-DNA glycosylase [Alterisphingorhabdus coralli]|uniref:Uracil-DNA glycosylase n=1 Tax=Alterisphingorhabdus coralli TaxID=3071408 RepID=A0AA97F6M2_9SPHN|nr:uracil-DNA glycosylase [Parasphingorhabdus sp. SCSIO 66989]WOE74911.1 uracil-DNA glycosylase [Parasphingorhabdus sp. SCSIO 66989]